MVPGAGLAQESLELSNGVNDRDVLVRHVAGDVRRPDLQGDLGPQVTLRPNECSLGQPSFDALRDRGDHGGGEPRIRADVERDAKIAGGQCPGVRMNPTSLHLANLFQTSSSRLSQMFEDETDCKPKNNHEASYSTGLLISVWNERG